MAGVTSARAAKHPAITALRLVLTWMCQVMDSGRRTRTRSVRMLKMPKDV